MRFVKRNRGSVGPHVPIADGLAITARINEVLRTAYQHGKQGATIDKFFEDLHFHRHDDRGKRHDHGSQLRG